MGQSVYECGGCGHEAQGYTRHELEQRDWVWHVLTKGAAGVAETWFILCDGCSSAADERRQDRADREAPQPSCSHCKQPTMVLPAANVVVGTEFARALPTSLCRGCDRYPELLRPRTEFEAGLLYPPAPGELT